MIRYAAKRLSSTDLAFFKCHSATAYSDTTNSIKFDSTVLVGQMYPYLRTAAHIGSARVMVLLSIYGPGCRRSPDQKTRMLFAHSAKQKTWHLTGECVPDPANDPMRYHRLKESDFAVFAIREAECQPLPKFIGMVLLAQTDNCDAGPFAILNSAMAKRSMIALPPKTVSALCAASSEDHPLRRFNRMSAPS